MPIPGEVFRRVARSDEERLLELLRAEDAAYTLVEIVHACEGLDPAVLAREHQFSFEFPEQKWSAEARTLDVYLAALRKLEADRRVSSARFRGAAHWMLAADPQRGP